MLAQRLGGESAGARKANTSEQAGQPASLLIKKLEEEAEVPSETKRPVDPVGSVGSVGSVDMMKTK